MSIRSLAARGLSFAHLAGIAPRGARAEDDKQDDENARAEDDDQEEQDRDDGDGSGSKGKKSKRAEDRTDDPDAEDDNDDVEDDSGKGKKGKRADDGDGDGDDEEDDTDPDAEDDDDEMRGKSAVARARRREQARCAAIMGSKAAGRNVELAANLAFKTRMTRQEALAILRTSPAGASDQSQARAARNPRLGAGGSVQRNSAQEASAGWERAFSKVAGRRG
jgi:hypothetical protein